MWLQPCSVSLHKASPPHTYTPARSVSLHSTSFAHSLQHLLIQLSFVQKNAPSWLPAAPCHRALRFPCQGHSLRSHRLAHNAQAHTSFRFTSLAFRLASYASSRLFYLFRFKTASPTPAPDHPPQIIGVVGLSFLIIQALYFTRMSPNPFLGLLMQFCYSLPFPII